VLLVEEVGLLQHFYASFTLQIVLIFVVLTGELLVGSARVLFMDEISTGLDSATTYQIIKYLRHSTHALDGTTIISLLQPAPETYELFDDVILIAEGQIVYQGPREYAVDFFAAMGFRCPERKNVADFLQEVGNSALFYFFLCTLTGLFSCIYVSCAAGFVQERSAAVLVPL
jgi:hypothetical protein